MHSPIDIAVYWLCFLNIAYSVVGIAAVSAGKGEVVAGHVVMLGIALGATLAFTFSNNIAKWRHGVLEAASAASIGFFIVRDLMTQGEYGYSLGVALSIMPWVRPGNQPQPALCGVMVVLILGYTVLKGIADTEAPEIFGSKWLEEVSRGGGREKSSRIVEAVNCGVGMVFAVGYVMLGMMVGEERREGVMVADVVESFKRNLSQQDHAVEVPNGTTTADRGSYLAFVSWLTYKFSFLPDMIEGGVEQLTATVENPLNPTLNTNESGDALIVLSNHGLHNHNTNPTDQTTDGIIVPRTNHRLGIVKQEVAVVHLMTGNPDIITEESANDFFSTCCEISRSVGGTIHTHDPTTLMVVFGLQWCTSPLSAAISFSQTIVPTLKQKHLTTSASISQGPARLGILATITNPSRPPQSSPLYRRGYHIFGSTVETNRWAVEYAFQMGYLIVTNEPTAAKARQLAHVTKTAETWDFGQLYLISKPDDQLLAAHHPVGTSVSSFKMTIETGLVSAADVEGVINSGGGSSALSSLSGGPPRQLANAAAEYICRGDMATGEILLQEALSVLGEEARVKGDLEVRDIMHGLCYVRESQGDWTGALPLRKELLMMEEELNGGGEVPHPDTALSLSHLGVICEKLFMLHDARSHHQQALVLYGKLGMEDREVQAMINLGATFIKMGNIPKAFANLQRAVDMLKDPKSSAKSDKLLGEALHLLYLASWRRGDMSKARISIEESLATGYVVLPDYSSPVTSNVLKAKYLWKNNELRAAAELLSQTRTNTELEDSLHSYILVTEAAVRAELHDLPSSLSLHQEALSLRRKSVTHAGHPLVIQALLSIAHLHLALNDHQSMRESLKEIESLPKYPRSTESMQKELAASLKLLVNIAASPEDQSVI